MFTKAKLDQAVNAGYLPPRLDDRAVKRVQEGWHVSLKRLAALVSDPAWGEEEG